MLTTSWGPRFAKIISMKEQVYLFIGNSSTPSIDPSWWGLWSFWLFRADTLTT